MIPNTGLSYNIHTKQAFIPGHKKIISGLSDFLKKHVSEQKQPEQPSELSEESNYENVNEIKEELQNLENELDQENLGNDPVIKNIKEKFREFANLPIV